MAGSFSQVELTQDDGDRNSHVSDIPLQLPASANVSSDSYALVTFEQAEDNLTLFKVSIRCRVRLGATRGYHSIPVLALSVHQQFLGLTKLFNWLHNEHEKVWMLSAKRLDVLRFINKDNFSLPLINAKRLRGKILSVLWQYLVRRTMIMC